MINYTCKMCAGALEIQDNSGVCTCNFCGTMQTVPHISDEKRIRLFERAEHLRKNNEFDKAIAVVDEILNEDSSDAEAYWLRTLCNYGIEYVDDNKTGKKVPTVNRTQYKSIYANEDYKSALKYAEGKQIDIYQKEAHQIDYIQKGILRIAQKEKPFDVFISYKRTDDDGNRTSDSVLANDLYHQLVQEGLNVFFAEITLENKLGKDYEPYIFAALNSAKVMLVLGTKPEYFQAVWVKNEWSRFINIISEHNDRILIPCYKNMDPLQLPEEFAHLQLQDMSKLGFVTDIIRGIKKIVNKPLKDSLENIPSLKVFDAGYLKPDVSQVQRRGEMAMDFGDFSEAITHFQRAQQIDNQYVKAFVYENMAKSHYKSFEEYEQYFKSLMDKNQKEVDNSAPKTSDYYNELLKKYPSNNFFNLSTLRECFNNISLLSVSLPYKQKIMDEFNEQTWVKLIKVYSEDNTEIFDLYTRINQYYMEKIEEAKTKDDENRKEYDISYQKRIKHIDDLVEKTYTESQERREKLYVEAKKQLRRSIFPSKIAEVDYSLNYIGNDYKDVILLRGKVDKKQKLSIAVLILLGLSVVTIILIIALIF